MTMFITKHSLLFKRENAQVSEWFSLFSEDRKTPFKEEKLGVTIFGASFFHRGWKPNYLKSVPRENESASHVLFSLRKTTTRDPGSRDVTTHSEEGMPSSRTQYITKSKDLYRVPRPQEIEYMGPGTKGGSRNGCA